MFELIQKTKNAISHRKKYTPYFLCLKNTKNSHSKKNWKNILILMLFKLLDGLLVLYYTAPCYPMGIYRDTLMTYIYNLPLVLIPTKYTIQKYDKNQLSCFGQPQTP